VEKKEYIEARNEMETFNDFFKTAKNFKNCVFLGGLIREGAKNI
jgi:hypothetical protein